MFKNRYVRIISYARQNVIKLKTRRSAITMRESVQSLPIKRLLCELWIKLSYTLHIFCFWPGGGCLSVMQMFIVCSYSV